MKDYKTEAEPKAMAGEIPVFCAHDEIVDIVKLVPNPKNPNQHPEDQIELLGRIIKATGWRQPITVSKRSGYIVKGHGRLQAAMAAGFTSVPVDFQNYANDAEEWADLVADNRLAELSDKGYSPKNCRFVDGKVNSNNRRDNLRIPFRGKERTVAEISKMTGIPFQTLYGRLYRGEELEQYVERREKGEFGRSWANRKSKRVPVRDLNKYRLYKVSE